MKETALRYCSFMIGLYILAFSIAMMAHASLGVSPISSINYVLSLQTFLSFGSATFLFNLVVVMLQFLLISGGVGTKKDRFEIFLQLPFLFIFSFFIDLNVRILSLINFDAYYQQVLFVLGACFLQALAVVIEVRSNVVIMPPDGFVKYAVLRYHKNFSKVKIIFDASLLTIAISLSIFMSGAISGVGEGSIIAAICVGLFVYLINSGLLAMRHLHLIHS